MNKLLEDYALFALVLIFIIISLYYRNVVNIAIFVVLFAALRNMVNDKQALLYSYCIAILYGIVRNFHLLENFVSENDSGNDNKTVIPGRKINLKSLFSSQETKEDIMKLNKNMNDEIAENQPNKQEPEKNLIKSKSKKSKGKNNDKGSASIKKLNKTDTHSTMNALEAPEMNEIISEDLINKFIRRLKKEDNMLITKERVNLYKINPTISKLSRNKVDKMKKKMLNDDKLARKAIVITNDYFILDGHHRWFAKKSLVENNTNGYNVGELYKEDINVVIIDYNIRKCVQKLQEYKIKYNKDYLNKTINEINNISNGKKYLDEMKDVIRNLESNLNNFANVELV